METRNTPAPQITLDTSNLGDNENEPTQTPLTELPQHRPGLSLTTPPQTAVDDSYLSPTTRDPKHKGDGTSPGSRSGSWSDSGATARTRADSGVSATSWTTTVYSKSSLEYESAEDALRPDPGNEPDFQVANNPFAFSPGQLNKLLNPKSLSAYKALGGLRGLEKGLRTSLAAGLSLDETHLEGQVTFDQAVAGSPRSEKPTEFEPIQPRRSSSSGLKSSHHHGNAHFEDRIRVYRDNRLPERKPDSIFVLIWRAYNDKILILLTIAAVISLALGIYETVSGGSSVDWVEGVAICVAIIIVVTVGAANDYQKERQFVKLNKRKDDREVKVIRSGKSIQISIHDVTVGDVLHMEAGDAIPADGIFISGHGVKCDESSATGESDQMEKTGGEEVWQRIQEGTATAKLDPFIISGSKVLEGVGTYLVTSVGQNSSFGKIMMSLQTTNEMTPLQVKLGKLANWIGGLGSSAAGLLFLVLLIKFLAALSSNPHTPAEKGQEFLDILIVAITNKMTVVKGTLGLTDRFASDHLVAEGDVLEPTGKVFGKLGRNAKELIRTSITLNSTAFEGEENGVATFIGSKTEVALLTLAKEQLGLENLAIERANFRVKQIFPFDSRRKCMGIVVKAESGFRLFVKGASEIMLAQATTALTNLSKDQYDVEPLSTEDRRQIEASIDDYAQQSLRTIGMLYKDFPAWPPADAKPLEDNPKMAEFDSVFHALTWVGVVGIHDPLRPGVVEAVAQCQHSGVIVRMVTGDNITTARAIARDCGILRKDDQEIVMEGPKFRQLSDAEMDAVLPKLRVLARSSPEDKRILVERLKKLGETVAVTGDGTNDGPALKIADVGFSMGIAGTEVAKEASSIILLDDNFSSTITALMWGRAVNDAVKKFLQFQITVNITAVVLTFVSAVSSESNHSVLTAVQLLWVNLIMDTLAALALATDPPTKKILDRPPQPKSQPLITINMWKMIIGQSIYQLAVTFTLYFAGMRIFNYPPSRRLQLDTVVFNSFVWMQIFNEFNNRRLDNKFNIFENIHKNFWFIGINCIMVGGQILIVFVGGKAFQITKLDGSQWAISILTALPCLLWAVLVRLFPDEWFAVVFNGSLRVFSAVFGPVWKALRVVFHPVAQPEHVQDPRSKIQFRMQRKGSVRPVVYSPP
ncbi:hypothetical protein DV738_g2506, partial [Chaetothyriales sp. CBS 135597]